LSFCSGGREEYGGAEERIPESNAVYYERTKGAEGA